MSVHACVCVCEGESVCVQSGSCELNAAVGDRAPLSTHTAELSALSTYNVCVRACEFLCNYLS